MSEIHCGNDLWICLAGYKYNFILELFWIECLFHIDVPLPSRAEVFLYGDAFQKHLKGSSSPCNSYDHTPELNKSLECH